MDPFTLIGGYLIYKGVRAVLDELRNPQQDSQTALPPQEPIVLLITMLAKFAKADGQVSKAEIGVIDELFREGFELDEESRTNAIHLFQEAKEASVTFEELAQQFYVQTHEQPEMQRDTLSILLRVAASNGVCHPEQERLLRAAVSIFHLDPAVYQRMKDAYFPNYDQYYAVLGCQRDDSFETIKAKYKKLVREYHPDSIHSKGLPEAFIRFAHEKFQEIQTAYEMIQQERKGGAA